MGTSFKAPLPALRRAVERVAKVVERRNTIAILGNVAVRAEAGGRVTVAGTDLDIWATAIMPKGAADVTTPGATTVPAALFLDILKKADGDVVFEANDEKGQATIRTGRSRFTLRSLSVDDLPDAPDAVEGASFDLPPKTLTRVAAALSFAISTEETRYYLNGVYLHAAGEAGEAPVLAAVATDGRRLSRLVLPAVAVEGEMPGVIVPRKMIGLFDVLAGAVDAEETVAVRVSPTRIAFETHCLRIVSKLVDGTYPDYQRVIPVANRRKARLERGEFAAAVDRVATISSERGRVVRFAFDGAGGLELGCQSPDAGDATDGIAAAGEFEAIEIGFNGRYVGDVLATFAGAAVEFALNDPGSPAVITDPADADRLVVLMPMRV